MARYAIIIDGKVANIAISDAALSENWVLVDKTVKIGDIKDGDTFTSPLPSGDDLRAIRDRLLLEEVDPIVSNPLRWADLTTEQQNAWAAYRRALLDITDQAGFPHSVTWPTKP